MGLFGKLFGKKDAPPDEPPPPEEPEAPDWPDAVIVLRRGMNLPAEAYVKQTVDGALPGLPESVPRLGLSQPSWFKNEEIADQIANGVGETFARKLELGAASIRRRVVDGPDGCACLLVELRRG